MPAVRSLEIQPLSSPSVQLHRAASGGMIGWAADSTRKPSPIPISKLASNFSPFRHVRMSPSGPKQPVGKFKDGYQHRLHKRGWCTRSVWQPRFFAIVMWRDWKKLNHKSERLDETTAAVDVEDFGIHIAVTEEKSDRLSNFIRPPGPTDGQLLDSLREYRRPTFRAENIEQ